MSEQHRTRPPRPTRTPIGSGNVLAAASRPGYFRKWVNEDQGRVEQFKAAGYEPVRDMSADTASSRKDSNLGSSIIRRNVGGGMTAILMEIPQEWHDEDRRQRWDDIDAVEKGLVRNQGRQANSEGQYGDVSISR